MTASSVAIMNSGRIRNDGNSGIISTLCVECYRQNKSQLHTNY